jgi:hypothetical protein
MLLNVEKHKTFFSSRCFKAFFYRPRVRFEILINKQSGQIGRGIVRVLSLVRMTVPVFGRQTIAIWLPGVSATMVVTYSKLEAAADPVDRAVRLSIAGNLLPDAWTPSRRSLDTVPGVERTSSVQLGGTPSRGCPPSIHSRFRKTAPL